MPSEKHQKDLTPSEKDVAFMRLALTEATAALERQEVPIGCVLVDESGNVVAKGSNRTNEKRDATRHAELEAFDALRACDIGIEIEKGDAVPESVIVGGGRGKGDEGSDGDESEDENESDESVESGESDFDDNDDTQAPTTGPRRPQPPPRNSLRGLTLYVTCEPCVMCAAALSILQPRRVVFGCHNPRFGGVGSVLNVVAGKFPGCNLSHEASTEGREGKGEGEGEATGGGGGLAVARPYETLGGVLASEAVALLKEFYETGNPSAPRPNRPEAAAATRAARKEAAAAKAAAAAAAALEKGAAGDDAAAPPPSTAANGDRC